MEDDNNVKNNDNNNSMNNIESSQNAADIPEEQSAQRMDSGLICLAMLARFHNIAAEPAQLAHEFQPDGFARG